LSEIKENPLGFYDWPVEKVVFVNPTLRGSTIRSWLILNKFRNAYWGMLNKYAGWEWGGKDVNKAMTAAWAGVLLKDGWDGVYREAYSQDSILSLIDQSVSPLKDYDSQVGSIARTSAGTIGDVQNASKWMQKSGGDILRWAENGLNPTQIVKNAIGPSSTLYQLSQGLMLKGDNGIDVGGFASKSVLDSLSYRLVRCLDYGISGCFRSCTMIRCGF
jgi:hypothetical protein